MQMAMVAAAGWTNGGRLMAPRFASRVVNQDGQAVETLKPDGLPPGDEALDRGRLQPDDADTWSRRGPVRWRTFRGSRSPARRAPRRWGCRLEHRDPWFIGFAPVDKPEGRRGGHAGAHSERLRRHRTPRRSQPSIIKALLAEGTSDDPTGYPSSTAAIRCSRASAPEAWRTCSSPRTSSSAARSRSSSPSAVRGGSRLRRALPPRGAGRRRLRAPERRRRLRPRRLRRHLLHRDGVSTGPHPQAAGPRGRSARPDRGDRHTIQILNAARFAHRRGIVHRDLKPHNVIIDESGHAKVTDFGIARAGASDMTETGSIMGASQYCRRAGPGAVRRRLLRPVLGWGRAVRDAHRSGTVRRRGGGHDRVEARRRSASRPRPLQPERPAGARAGHDLGAEQEPADRPRDADDFVAALEGGKGRDPGRWRGDSKRQDRRAQCGGRGRLEKRARAGHLASAPQIPPRADPLPAQEAGDRRGPSRPCPAARRAPWLLWPWTRR